MSKRQASQKTSALPGDFFRPVTQDIRPLDYTHWELLYLWRTDEDTVRFSQPAKQPNVKEHHRWMHNRILNPAQKVYVYHEAGVPVGSFTLTILEPGVEAAIELGYVVSPRHRRQGVGTRMVRAAMHLIPRGYVVRASVHESNLASRRILEKRRFTEYGTTLQGYDDKPAAHFRLLELTPWPTTYDDEQEYIG